MKRDSSAFPGNTSLKPKESRLAKIRPVLPRAAALLLSAALSSMGCFSRTEAKPAEIERPELLHTAPWSPPSLDTSAWRFDGTSFDSEEQAVKAALEALSAGDMEKLASMTVNRREYTEYLYPFCPVSAPARNSPASFVWDQHWLKASAGMKRSMAREEHRGARYKSHSFRRPPEKFGPMTLLGDVIVTVTCADGRVAEIEPFRSLAEMKGRYKIFSFRH